MMASQKYQVGAQHQQSKNSFRNEGLREDGSLNPWHAGVLQCCRLLWSSACLERIIVELDNAWERKRRVSAISNSK